MTDFFLSETLTWTPEKGWELPSLPRLQKMRLVLLTAVPEPWWSISDVEANRYDDQSWPVTGVRYREGPGGVTLFADDVKYAWRGPSPSGYMLLAGNQPVVGGTMLHAVMKPGPRRDPWVTRRGVVAWRPTGILAPAVNGAGQVPSGVTPASPRPGLL